MIKVHVHLEFQLLNLSLLILEHIFRDCEALFVIHAALLLTAVLATEGIEASSML